MTSESRSLSSAVAEVVRQRSEILFGLMGNGNAHLISSLTSGGFRYVGARHEAGTVAMADAYYRASRKIATATVTYGAGFTNALTSLAEARMARIPLVLIVGDAPSTGLRPWDVDQPMIAAGMGVRTVVLRAENVVADVVEAYEIALRESVPVVVSIPYDLATAPVTEPVPSETLNTAGPGPAAGYRQQVDAEAVKAVGRALTAAERPLIVAGRGVVEAAGSAQLWRDIGDRVGAMFATSVMARNAFDSPWDLGVAGGFAQLPAAEVMGRADVVLVVGASLNMFQMRYGTLFGPEAKVIQIDIREGATHERVDLFVQADAYAFAARLLEGLEGRAENQAWRDQVPAPVGPRVGPEETGCCADGRLNPQPFAHALEEILPKNRTIVQDGGHFSGWMPMYCSAPDPQGLMLVGTAFQTIGLGFPAAVGAAAARPERTTVLVTGDGGGLMALADMDTFIRTARSGLVVVFNDAAYGAELHQYAVRGLDATAMLIDEVDFAAVGRALGAHGLKARSLADLQVLRDWVEAGANGVFVLDLPVSQSEVAPYMRESVDLAMAQERQLAATK